MNLTNGQQIDLVRYTDNSDIEVTKTIEKVTGSTIKFKGLKKIFTIQRLRDGSLQFVNNDTIYCSEPLQQRQTHFQKYGAFKVIELEK